jgi:hypothetical protein
VNQKYKISILYLISLPLLTGLRIYLLKDNGLYDYDSVKNFLVAKEMAAGNFAQLFNHVSPTFNLLYAFLYKVFKDYLILEYLNAVFNILAIFTFAQFLFRNTKLDFFQITVVLLLSGCSLFMVNSSRYFAIESLSLFLFVLLIINYYKNLISGSSKYFYWAVLFFALLLTVNRKALVFLPVVLVIEFLQNNRRLTLRNVAFGTGIVLSFFIIYPLIGYALGLKFLQYYASLFYLIVHIQGHPTMEYATFNGDIFYYLKYFYYFENPLLIGSILLFPVLYRKELFRNIREINIYQFLFIITYSFLFGMAVLPKAPRGLLFIYIFLYLFLFLCLHKISRNKIILCLMTALILLFDVYQIKEHIYKYAHTNYSEVARYIDSKKIKRVATTVGINIIPFLKEGVEVKMIFNEAELLGLKEKGYDYVLLDDFHYLVNINQFNELHKAKPVLQVKEPTLLAPLMSLEQSEYSSIGFEETLRLREKVKKDEFQLRLIDLSQFY